MIFDRGKYYPLYFDYTTKVRIYHCPKCGADLYQIKAWDMSYLDQKEERAN